MSERAAYLRAEAETLRHIARIFEVRADEVERIDDEPVMENPAIEVTWRERIWTAPAETRIGKAELLEATGKSESWLYRLTGRASTDRIPHRKDSEGSLVFVVGEVRSWLRSREIVVVPGDMARDEMRRLA